MKNKEILIIGGGLAGLTAAIHLSKIGFQVLVIEKNAFPKHKVCGEYISNEVLPYFNWLGITIETLQPTRITNLQFSTANGTTITSALPLGGFGISRYTLDYFLYQKALENGCQFLQETVENVTFSNTKFKVETTTNQLFEYEIVLGAFGKRSTLDQKLKRSFFQKKSNWLGVKAHYTGNFPDDLVGLHHFEGGYCGVSKVENDILNICYLTDYKTFKPYKNTEDYQKMWICKNPNLKSIFENATLLFEKPLTISQIAFDKKEAVYDHMLLIGDTAGLIHPLCGNGMAMAIHSAKLAAELVAEYNKGTIASRTKLEHKYTQVWNFNFKHRIQSGRWLAQLLQHQKATALALQIIIWFPALLTFIITKTHGKPIVIHPNKD
ncbi:NAD(P)/FAD-dependent oxidoreductase [Flavobacterium restrictum]|uniref:NAD(P)/FAD-dependent oxidoreductase n=1 Tax=Flavobacterium restrictum TaxID=2594428 RepID=A0A553ED78_9FLAO|nr:NAD(P)/FAD-dependent oxidoreductase [Flavobacterium restrictum]TRX42932.1 NAD(P)/FAD-dependent oxidoreductase [Flavobacterium restrictum]